MQLVREVWVSKMKGVFLTSWSTFHIYQPGRMSQISIEFTLTADVALESELVVSIPCVYVMEMRQ